MTLAELRTLPLWKLLPAAIRNALDEAESLGWELHGKGATIAFRLDRGEDLDMPVYAQWQIGVTPKGAISFKGGKAGVPSQLLGVGTSKDHPVSDLSAYLRDPTTAYPLDAEEECQPSGEVPEALRALGASLVSSPTSAPSALNAGGTTEDGTPSVARSTATGKPAPVTTRPSSGSAATPATSAGTSGTSSSTTKAPTLRVLAPAPRTSSSPARPLRV